MDLILVKEALSGFTSLSGQSVASSLYLQLGSHKQSLKRVRSPNGKIEAALSQPEQGRVELMEKSHKLRFYFELQSSSQTAGVTMETIKQQKKSLQEVHIRIT